MIQHNGQTLAYIGDAVFEVLVREYHLSKNITNVGKLHEACVAFTSAKGQLTMLENIQDQLTEEEMSIVKRGRNSNLTRKARNTNLRTYQYATGLEALFGYLYLSQQSKRLNELFQQMMNTHTQKG